MQKLIKYSALCIDEEHLYINEKNITTLEYIADTTKLVRKPRLWNNTHYSKPFRL